MPYMAKFGIFTGVVISRKLFPKNSSKKTIEFKIPQCKHPISVRLGTTDVANFHENFLHDEFDLPPLLEPKLIVDAGANVGYSALFFLNKYPQAKVIAIEPEDTNFGQLVKNCGDYPNFQGINSGIWIENCYIKIKNPEASKTAFQITKAEVGEKGAFLATTIDKVLLDSGFDKIDILKIDVEGTEKELFEGNYHNWIEKVKVLIIELHDRFKPGCSIAFYNAIEQTQFRQFSKGENIVYVK